MNEAFTPVEAPFNSSGSPAPATITLNCSDSTASAVIASPSVGTAMFTVTHQYNNLTNETVVFLNGIANTVHPCPGVGAASNVIIAGAGTTQLRISYDPGSLIYTYNLN